MAHSQQGTFSVTDVNASRSELDRMGVFSRVEEDGRLTAMAPVDTMAQVNKLLENGGPQGEGFAGATSNAPLIPEGTGEEGTGEGPSEGIPTPNRAAGSEEEEIIDAESGEVTRASQKGGKKK